MTIFDDHAVEPVIPRDAQGWISLLLDPAGQIGRARFWAGTGAVLAAVALLHAVALPDGASGFDPQLSPGMAAARIGHAAEVRLVIWLMAAYPLAVLLAKRLRDIARPSYLALAGLAPHYLLLVLAGMGLTVTQGSVWEMPVLQATWLSATVELLRAVAVLWILRVPGMELGWTALPGAEDAEKSLALQPTAAE